MSKLTDRYVGVLFSSADNFEESVSFENGLKAISKTYMENEEFRTALSNPGVTEGEKAEVVKSVFSEYMANAKFASFVLEIINENKMNEIVDISEEYAKVNSELMKKIDTIKSKFPEYTKDAEFTGFLTEMLRKDKISQVESMFNDYSKSISSSNKELDIKIIVASDLDEDQIDQVVKKFKEMYKADTVNYTVEVDKSVIGGIKVAVGNTIYDGTLETRLKDMF